MSTTVIDSKLQKYGALVLRLSLGAILLAHGVVKTFNFAGTLEFFGSLGLPPVLAYFVAALEIIGGLLLILGIQTRWAALSVLPGLLGATWVHIGNGWLFSSTGGGWEYPLLLALLAIAQALLGNGAFPLLRTLRLTWHTPEAAS